MGKKPKKHRAKQPAQEVTVQGPHRRDVLKWMWVGTSALGVLAYTGYNLFSSSNKWAFLEIDPEVYCRTYWTEIVKDGVALLPEFDVPEDSYERVIIEDRLREGITTESAKAGVSPERIRFTKQQYGIPLEKEVETSFIEYCRTAESFLHKNIRGLNDQGIEWLGMNDVKNPNAWSHKAYVGGIGALVMRGYYALAGTQHIAGDHDHDVGGKCNTVINEQMNDLQDFYIILGVGRTAIKSPFSEIIPLTTSPITLKYVASLTGEELVYVQKIFGNQTPFGDIARQLDEGICEALSHVLGLKISAELKIPRGKEMLQAHLTDLTKEKDYRLVSGTIAWIEKHSPQEALDLYKKSPGLFLRAIEPHLH